MGKYALFLLECRQLRFDRVFWAVTLTFLLAVLFGLANGQRWADEQNAQINYFEQQSLDKYQNSRKQADELRQHNAPAADNLAARNADPRYALGFEGSNVQHICRHSSAIAALTVGQSDLYNACILVSAWAIGGGYDERLHRNLENPMRLLFGRFDTAFVMITLLPIAILILSYNQLSSEREQGTLSLLACQPLAVRRIIAMRFMVRAVIFLLLLLLPLSLALWSNTVSLNHATALNEYLVWLIATALYALFWFACGFWVNARSKSTAENGLLLAGLWLLLVVVLPGCLNLGLKQLYPVPSRMEFIDASRAATIDVGKRKTELLGKYLIDHPDRVKMTKQVNVDDFIQTRMAIDDETKRVLAPGLTAFSAQQQQQRNFVGRLRFLSPAIIYQQLTQLLTGQGQDRQQAFLDATDDYHHRLRAFYFPRFAQDSPDFSDYNGIPPFQDQPVTLSELWSKIISDYLGLSVPALLFAGVGWWRMRQVSIQMDDVR
ncbi:MAG: ABC transporter permease subunit [Methylococcaceae bacterium]|jgi:ABC-2 type transport system permease protein